MFSQMCSLHSSPGFLSFFLCFSLQHTSCSNLQISKMDHVKSQKLRALKSYQKNRFLHSLIFHSLVAITCSFVCSYPFWFPSLASSTKYLVSISLPNIWRSLWNPKCLFIVFNVIVAFLVGESKLLGPQSSSAGDIYSEYVERRQTLRETQQRHCFTIQEKKEGKLPEMNLSEEKVEDFEDKEVVLPVKEDKPEEELEEDEEFKEVENSEEKEDQEKGPDEEDDGGLPAEELNKRADAFIARVNRQRWLEARTLIRSTQT